MTTPNPPVPPTDPSRDPSGTPTEPVPSMWAPPDDTGGNMPAAASAGVSSPGAAPMTPTAPAVFQAAAPEPDPIPVVTPVQPTVRRSAGGGLLNVALGVAVLIAASGIAFAVGRGTAPASTAAGPIGVRTFRSGAFGPGGSFDPGADAGKGQVPGGGGRFGFGGSLSIEGTLDSVTADSVTIKTANGETITVGLDANTAYHQQAAGSQADVTQGKTVVVQLSGGFRPGANAGNGNGSAKGGGTGGTNGSITLGSAGSVTVVP